MPGRIHRRTFVAVAAATLAGCSALDGESTPTPSGGNPAVGDARQLGDLALTSPAFDDGEAIPRRYGHGEENVNPPLEIRNVPDGAEALVLVVDDPDAVDPAGKVWLHWLMWNVPPSTTSIPEGWDPPSTAVEGTNDFGNRGYGGPAPPDEEHSYRFKLYAMEATLDLPDDAGKRRVGEAMTGHVLASTQLEGTYAP